MLETELPTGASILHAPGGSSAGAPGEIGLSHGMSQQPELTSPPISSSPQAGDAIPPEAVAAPNAVPSTHGHVPQRIPRWLERSELFLRVLLRMWIGLICFFAPWAPWFWDQNPLFLRYPTLSIWATHGAVRGIISGIGLLNLWIAVQRAVRHRDG
jgi:hypothetical protein